MSRLILATGAATLVVAACVTINVYFPAAEAQEAADQVIENVWGPGEADKRSDASAVPRALSRVALSVLDWFVAPAAAQAVDIDVSSPGVRRLEASMQARHDSRLAAYYASGAIGLTRDAMVEIRDLGAVPLPERNALKKLVADENADRAALYREIAVANGHPEWEDRIRATFADRWVAKARAGWYFRDAGGNWRQK